MPLAPLPAPGAPWTTWATSLHDTVAANETAVAGSTRVALWNGSAYTVNGVVVTSNNRPTGTFYKFIGGPDPVSLLGSAVVNGDEWKDAA